MHWIPRVCEELHAGLEVVDRFLPKPERGKIRFCGPEENDRQLLAHFLPELERPDDYPVFSIDIEGPSTSEHFLLIPHPRVAKVPLTGEKTIGFAAICVHQSSGHLRFEPWTRAEDSPCGIAIWAMETLLGKDLAQPKREEITTLIQRVIHARNLWIEYSLPSGKLQPKGPLVPGHRSKSETEAILISLPPDPIQSDWGTGATRQSREIGKSYTSH